MIYGSLRNKHPQTFLKRKNIFKENVFENMICGPFFSYLDICVNTLRLRQNAHHFADDIFRCIFVNEMFCILINISLKFVSNGPINNNPVLA